MGCDSHSNDSKQKASNQAKLMSKLVLWGGVCVCQTRCCGSNKTKHDGPWNDPYQCQRIITKADGSHATNVIQSIEWYQRGQPEQKHDFQPILFQRSVNGP